MRETNAASAAGAAAAVVVLNSARQSRQCNYRHLIIVISDLWIRQIRKNTSSPKEMPVGGEKNECVLDWDIYRDVMRQRLEKKRNDCRQ